MPSAFQKFTFTPAHSIVNYNTPGEPKISEPLIPNERKKNRLLQNRRHNTNSNYASVTFHRIFLRRKFLSTRRRSRHTPFFSSPLRTRSRALALKESVFALNKIQRGVAGVGRGSINSNDRWNNNRWLFHSNNSSDRGASGARSREK